MGQSPGNAHFLSYLDVYACLPQGQRTPSMERRVQLIRDLWDEFVDTLDDEEEEDSSNDYHLQRCMNAV